MFNNSSFIDSNTIDGMPFWKRCKGEHGLLHFDLEVNACCNHNCRHCWINVPANDEKARQEELSLSKIKELTDQAVDLGALFCLITGGEPLLREDFFDIVAYLKKKGLLITLFTNATLLTRKHIEFFKTYPLFDLEVSVYGVTQETYESITRKPGSFKAFMKGVKLLSDGEIKVRFKTVPMRSNIKEFPQILRFCQERTKDYWRYSSQLCLRGDRDYMRNAEIQSERLSPQEISDIEQSDLKRFKAMGKRYDKFLQCGFGYKDNHLFRCRIGTMGCTVSYDGFFRGCLLLMHPDCRYDLRKTNLKDAWENFSKKVRAMRLKKNYFIAKCRACRLTALCEWCPACAYLETGKLDMPIEYFCELAKARDKALKKYSSVRRDVIDISTHG